MSSESQLSIISYTLQPFFIDFSTSVPVIITGSSNNIDSVENEPGIFDPDLSNYTTFNVTEDAQTFGFSASLLDILIETVYTSTLALIGVGLVTYEDDGGSPDLDTEFYEAVSCIVDDALEPNGSEEYLTFAHNSSNAIKTFNAEPMPGIIAGGTANLIYSNLQGPPNYSGSDFKFIRDPANVTARPHAKLIIGHLFKGVDIVIDVNPSTFSWSLKAEQQRFRSRSAGSISSEGTLVRRSSGEIRHIIQESFVGSGVTGVNTDGPGGASEPYPDVTPVANFFDMIKGNNSYPLLFNPYPHLITNVKDATPLAVTVEDYNLSARQNFFSIYGFLEDPLELLPGEFRDGLDSEYKARFRIMETR